MNRTHVGHLCVDVSCPAPVGDSLSIRTAFTLSRRWHIRGYKSTVLKGCTSNFFFKRGATSEENRITLTLPTWCLISRGTARRTIPLRDQ